MKQSDIIKLITRKQEDLGQLRADMRGISPNTSTYKRLKADSDRIGGEIAELKKKIKTRAPVTA